MRVVVHAKETPDVLAHVRQMPHHEVQVLHTPERAAPRYFHLHFAERPPARDRLRCTSGVHVSTLLLCADPQPSNVQGLEVHVRACTAFMFCVSRHAEQSITSTRTSGDLEQGVLTGLREVKTLTQDVLHVWITNSGDCRRGGLVSSCHRRRGLVSSCNRRRGHWCSSWRKRHSAVVKVRDFSMRAESLPRTRVCFQEAWRAGSIGNLVTR